MVAPAGMAAVLSWLPSLQFLRCSYSIPVHLATPLSVARSRRGRTRAVPPRVGGDELGWAGMRDGHAGRFGTGGPDPRVVAAGGVGRPRVVAAGGVGRPCTTATDRRNLCLHPVSDAEPSMNPECQTMPDEPTSSRLYYLGYLGCTIWDISGRLAVQTVADVCIP